MKHKNIAIFVPHAGCPHRCAFCDQHAITAQQTVPRGADVERICEEAFKQITNLSETEIAFFGGSFTAIPRGLMLELLQAAKPDAQRCRGVRVSTRPDHIDEEVLAILREYHVSAIELGAQSLDDAVLTLNERGHTAADVCRASKRIREHGFELGLQIMPGLFGADVCSDARTAQCVCEIAPDTVRIYPVVILKGTKLGDLFTAGEYSPLPFEAMVRSVAVWCRSFRERGIRVIKVGLHASEFVQEHALGGYYHPAFRELCEAYEYRLQIEGWLQRHGFDRGALTVRVHPTCISKAVGQKRANLRYVQEHYGIAVRIVGDASVEPFDAVLS